MTTTPDTAEALAIDELAAWLPDLMVVLVARGEADYYVEIERLVTAELERQGPGPNRLERRVIGIYEAWYMRRWRVRARITPAAAKAAREIAAYLRSYRKADDELAARTWANVLACYDELPDYLQGRTMLKLNKHLPEALAHLKAYHVAPAARILDYWQAVLAVTPALRKEARLKGKSPGATADAIAAAPDCFPIHRLEAATYERSMAMLLRGFELQIGLRVNEVGHYARVAAVILKEYPMLLTLDVAYAFARAARGETLGWNHAQGYNVHRIMADFRKASLSGAPR